MFPPAGGVSNWYLLFFLLLLLLLLCILPPCWSVGPLVQGLQPPSNSCSSSSAAATIRKVAVVGAAGAVCKQSDSGSLPSQDTFSDDEECLYVNTPDVPRIPDSDSGKWALLSLEKSYSETAMLPSVIAVRRSRLYEWATGLGSRSSCSISEFYYPVRCAAVIEYELPGIGRYCEPRNISGMT